MGSSKEKKQKQKQNKTKKQTNKNKTKKYIQVINTTNQGILGNFTTFGNTLRFYACEQGSPYFYLGK